MAGAIVAVIAGLVFRRAVDGRRTEMVRVSGTQVWTDSGIDLAEGDTVGIDASGEVFHAVELDQRSGPAGAPGLRYDSNVLKTSDHNSLLGRLGDEREPFEIGEHKEFTAEADGRLYLGINDYGVSNNSGAYEAEVTVSPR